MSNHIISTFNYFENDNAVALNKKLLGGKGLGLINMSKAGLPVPEAIILTTAAWDHYRKTGHLPDNTMKDINTFLEEYPSSSFSVRSGAPISMPGMMDTVLNVGVTPGIEEIYPGAYHRFVTGWLDVVKGVPKPKIKELFEHCHARAHLKEGEYAQYVSKVISAASGVHIPYSREEQIWECVKAVFDSWDTPRARAYRKAHDIDEDMGTGCIIQRMVMGTAEGFSGSGVMFTCDPATGENKIKGEIAFNCQGEEVVSGEITPDDIDNLFHSTDKQENVLYEALVNLSATLETTYTYPQDIEFTLEAGQLYVLQTRDAKMSARAKIVSVCSIAQPMLPEYKLPYLKKHIQRGDITKTMTPTVDTHAIPMGTGLAASPGAIAGRIVFRSTPLHKIMKDCILVCEETSPDDFAKMSAAGGILTSTGGFTCHSAVVARGMGIPAVVGCTDMAFELGTSGQVTISDTFYAEGDYITIDGSAGEIHDGKCKVKKSQPPREIYETLAKLAASYDIPKTAYYLECAIGDYVALTLNPADIERCEAQIARAYRLGQKGKIVGWIIDMPGFGEDLLDVSVQDAFAEVVEHFGPDLKGQLILGGVGPQLRAEIANLTGMVSTTIQASVVDLLDLLG